jgi:hypothetical protein
MKKKLKSKVSETKLKGDKLMSLYRTWDYTSLEAKREELTEKLRTAPAEIKWLHRDNLIFVNRAMMEKGG